MSEFMKRVLENLFTEEEYNLLGYVTPNSLNIDELKKTGEVTITESETDGIVTKQITYVSNDGTTSFEKTHYYSKQNENTFKITELEEQLEQALRSDTVEGYEKAAQIKRQIQELKNPA